METMLYRPIKRMSEGGEQLPSIGEVGGKGYGLYWLASYGFPAPETWVIGTQIFDMTVQRAGVKDLIAGMWASFEQAGDDWSRIQRAMDAAEPQRLRVVEAFRQVPWFDRVATLLSSLPSIPVQWAVRSSATVEDNPKYSFAGQFRSLLSVPNDLRALWDAVREVWASTFNRQALSYCIQYKTGLPRMAVILQPMEPILSQDRSGVVFSHSPVPTMPGVLIQATYGTGQTVVEGYGGDLYWVKDGKVMVQPMPTSQIHVTGTQGYLTQTLPPSGPVLSEAEAFELAHIVKNVAEQWNGPVDIEFVWRKSAPPTLVQVRTATGSH